MKMYVWSLVLENGRWFYLCFNCTFILMHSLITYKSGDISLLLADSSSPLTTSYSSKSFGTIFNHHTNHSCTSTQSDDLGK